jgi:signal peptidase I
MEEKLFWISLVSGVYALGLKWFLKKPARVADWRATGVVNGLFWGFVGAVAGVLAGSYREAPTEIIWRQSLWLCALGLAAGFAYRAFKNRSEETSRSLLHEDLEWADTGFSAVLMAAFIMYFFFQAFKIPSGSMMNTLLIGDHLFVNKLRYGVRIPYTDHRVFRLREVRRGDVIVFRFPTEDASTTYCGKDFIKRAVAVGGDTVQVKDKILYVNGASSPEPHVFHDDALTISPEEAALPPSAWQELWAQGRLGERVRDNFGPVTVPPGHYFAMGDNRDRSYDSRFWGPLPDRYLKGRAAVVYFPLRRAKIIR